MNSPGLASKLSVEVRDPPPQEEGGSLGALIRVCAVCAALLFSRWWFFPPYLITFDEVNFALAIDKFSPLLHQPQPPGYPLFVGLLKLLSVFIADIENVFLTAVLLLSAASLALLWWICELMLGSGRGIIGPLLLLFNPAFWLAALTNPVRLSLSAGATAVALCVWLTCRRNSKGWFLLACAALGFSAGFRPGVALVMAPLVVWSAWRIRAGWQLMALAPLACLGAVCTWLPSLLSPVGGWSELWKMLTSYSGDQFGASSLLFGANWPNAVAMAWRALAWSCLGALSWLWAVPVIARRSGLRLDGFISRFLTIWFVPGLLFYAGVHVGDPDHTLSIIPVTCIAGAFAIAALTHGRSRGRRRTVIAVCVLLNIFLFFKPITKTTKASTYAVVRSLQGYITNVIEGTRSLQSRGPVTAIFYEFSQGWRQLSYYEPQIQLVVVKQRTGEPVTIWHIAERQIKGTTSTDGTVALPACGTLVWIDWETRPVASNGSALQPINPVVFATQGRPSQSFDFRGFRFNSAAELCGGKMQ